MARTHAYDRPLTIEVIDGEVVMLSPDGPLGISLTPDAAAQTAAALAAAARTAALTEALTEAKGRPAGKQR